MKRVVPIGENSLVVEAIVVVVMLVVLAYAVWGFFAR